MRSDSECLIERGLDAAEGLDEGCMDVRGDSKAFICGVVVDSMGFGLGFVE